MIEVPSFYDLPEIHRATLIEIRSRGAKVDGRREGLAGEIFFLDQGVGVSPRRIVAKAPLPKRDPVSSASAFLRELEFQRGLAWHQFVHWPYDVEMVLDAPIAWFRRWDGDLSEWMVDPNFNHVERVAFLLYLTNALMHCHSRGLDAHQDLKPENIFVRNRRIEVPPEKAFALVTPMVGDFGSANLGRLIKEYGGTAAYMAPEQWREEPLTSQTSVWSVGVIGYELMSHGVHPYGRRIRSASGNISISRNRWKALGGHFSPPKSLPDANIDNMLRSCIAVDPADRPELQTLHDFLLKYLIEVMPAAGTQAQKIIYATDAVSSKEWPALNAKFIALREAAVDQLGPEVLAPPTRR